MDRFKQFLRRAWVIFSPFRKHFAVTLLLLVLSETIASFTPYSLKKVVDLATERAPIELPLMWIGLGLIGFVIFMCVNLVKDVYELRYIDFDLGRHLAKLTMSKMLGFSIGQHRSQNSGITQSVINQGQSALVSMVNQLLYQVLPIITRLVITLAVIFVFNKWVGLVVIAGSALYTWLSTKQSQQFWPEVKDLQDVLHRTNKASKEIIENVSLVQVQAQETKIEKEHASRLEKYVDRAQNVWIPFNYKTFPRQLLPFLIRSVVQVVATVLVYRQGHPVGDIVALNVWTVNAMSGLWDIGKLQRSWLDLSAAIEKYFAILDVQPIVILPSNPVRPRKFSGDVEFRNVTFTYPNIRYIDIDEHGDGKGEKPAEPALVDVSFKIPAGRRVAFVGESGAGKSTIINLLVRGYDPDNGQILVDGHDLRLLDLKRYRESLGLVEQNVALFDNTLRYNLLFGMNGKGEYVTEEDLTEVARTARIDRFSHRLTAGWDTKLGENGLKLSGGEKQRVGIARALIKSPPILILDEATSSLDGKNERLIKEAVNDASVDRTTIIIAHRLSTVRDVDKIFVMDKGRIVAEGQHDELCRHSPEYKELVESQLFAI